jgi:hypothetical protein
MPETFFFWTNKLPEIKIFWLSNGRLIAIKWSDSDGKSIVIFGRYFEFHDLKTGPFAFKITFEPLELRISLALGC